VAGFHWGITPGIYFGNGTFKELPDMIKSFGGKHVLFLTDPGIMKIGFGQQAMDMMKAAGLTYESYTEIEANPTDVMLDKIMAQIGGKKFDVIVALGGGSPIDTGKAVNILLNNPAPISQYDGFHKVNNPGIPLICLPTTAGTGSECSAASVITNTAAKKKMVIKGKNVAPTLAICDPELTYGLPPRLTAATGMDALAHAMESYISIIASVMAQVDALKAMELIYNNLLRAYKNPSDKEARYNMMLGSTIAGKAFGNTDLGMCHAMSMPLGAFYGISHGDGNAICLPPAMKHNSKAVPERFIEMGVAMKMGSASELTPEKVADNIYKLSADLGTPKISAFGIGPEHFTEELLDAIMMEGALQTNPVKVSREEFKEILLTL